jgi:hypothetical protein
VAGTARFDWDALAAWYEEDEFDRTDVDGVRLPPRLNPFLQFLQVITTIAARPAHPIG